MIQRIKANYQLIFLWVFSPRLNLLCKVLVYVQSRKKNMHKVIESVLMKSLSNKEKLLSPVEKRLCPLHGTEYLEIWGIPPKGSNEKYHCIVNQLCISLAQNSFIPV